MRRLSHDHGRQVRPGRVAHYVKAIGEGKSMTKITKGFLDLTNDFAHWNAEESWNLTMQGVIAEKNLFSFYIYLNKKIVP